MGQLDNRRRYAGKAASAPILGLNWLKFTAIDSGTFSIRINQLANISSISYSLDDGLTWTTTNRPANTEITVTTPTIASGDSVLWKGIGTSYSNGDSMYNTSRFSSTGLFDISGNIMSLLYGDDFEDKTSLQKNIGAFWYLFCFAGIVSAENLLLPATTLSANCYNCMFNSCHSLQIAPELPAYILAESCYTGMFQFCYSLTSHGFTPSVLAKSCCYCMYDSCTALSTFTGNLHVTTLADSCYESMFTNCKSLVTFPSSSLPSTCAPGCYKSMFSYCTSLITFPFLYVGTAAANCCERMFEGCTSLNNISIALYKSNANYCYAYMFQNCSSLTTPPSITNSALANYCYQGMFFGCTSLATAPALPQTTLKTGCYSVMFFRCTSLTTAPTLPATTLVSNCYTNMFNGCSKLNYIKAMFTTTPGTTYTNNWVKGVAASGTFVKKNTATWNVSGDSGIPSGWTVQTASS